MTRIRTRSTFLLWVVLAVLAFALACGKESPPPPPPAPPPFQPQTVVVDLGANGGKTTLVSTQAGGWTRNGEAFTSGGTVQGENDATYKLTLSEGRWTAEFVPPDPETVPLGASGEEISIQKQEDGSYLLDDEPLTEGQVLDAANGNQYQLTQGEDGKWTAVYVTPDPTSVVLGGSGESVSLLRQEDGTFSLDGTPLVSGEVRVAANENRYRFIQRPDGAWVAEFVPTSPVRVALGNSGDAAEVTLLEDRSYVLDGEPLVDGQTRVFESGNTYRFDLAADGTWSATYVPVTVTVELGTRGGSIDLTRLESGAYTSNGAVIESGQIVVGNGRRYRLTFGDGRWVAEHDPDSIQVRVPSEDVIITLLEREDGQIVHDGSVVESGDEVTVGESIFELRFANGRWTAEFIEERLEVELGSRGDFITVVRLPNGNYEYDGRRIRNRSVIRSPSTGIRYTLLLRDGTWTSRVYFPPTPGGGDPGGGSPGGGGTPTTVEDLEEAVPTGFLRNSNDGSLNLQADLVQVEVDDAEDEQGTTLDYSGYRGSGAVETETFVEAARKVLQSAVDDIKPLIGGDDSQLFAARVVIQDRYQKVREALDGIFTNGGTTLLPRALPPNPDNIDEERVLDDFEDLLGALQDLESFRSEMRTGGDLSEFSALRDDAREIFNASKGSIAIGATENTRFGVIAELDGSPTAQSIVTTPASFVTRAFAYSPLDATLMTRLPNRGEARYSGRTFAVASDGDVFAGTIDLRLWMGIERLEAEITNLTSTGDDSAWQHNGRSVTTITLPRVGQLGLADVGGNFRFDATGNAEINVEGSVFGTDVSGSDLTGYFVGDTGEEAFGTWAIGDLLDGAFGANRQSVSRVTLPSPPDSNGLSVEFNDIPTSDVTYDPTADTIQIVDAPAQFSEGDKTNDVFRLSQLYGGATVTRTETIGTGDDAVLHTLRVRLRRTSYTRFGVWTHTAPTDTPTTNQGIFGYGNLGASTISGDDHPRNVLATYNGRTVAVSEGNILEGNITVTVDWSDGGGRVESVIRQISPTLLIRGTQVSLIAFEENAFSGMSFRSPDGAKVEYVTGTEESTLTDLTHTGQFLGASLDGPVAVLGSWGFTSVDFSIEGKFGADLVPAP